LLIMMITVMMMMMIIIIIIIKINKINRNKSRKQGNHIVESISTNSQNDSQQQIRHYNS